MMALTSIEATPEEISAALTTINLPIPFKIKERGFGLSQTHFDYDPKIAPPIYKTADAPTDQDVADMVLTQFRNDLNDTCNLEI